MAKTDFGRIAYGCWRLTETHDASVEQRINTALDLGFKLIDTADIYGFTDPDNGIMIAGADADGFGGAEAVLGDCIARDPGLRDRMILATKGGIRPPLPYNSSPKYLTKALESSLKRLRTDYIDLYQIHRPDLMTDYPALAKTLDGFVASGKVKALGVSNFTPSQIRALTAHLKTPLLTHQPEISLWATESFEDGTLDICAEFGMTPLAWSPLARGSLLVMPKTQRMKSVQEALMQYAKSYGATPSQIALAFLLTHPIGIIPIIGTQTPARMKDAAGAIDIKLSREDWYKLYVARRGEALP